MCAYFSQQILAGVRPRRRDVILRNAYEVFMEGSNRVKCPCCNRNEIDLLQQAGRDGAHIVPGLIANF